MQIDSQEEKANDGMRILATEGSNCVLRTRVKN